MPLYSAGSIFIMKILAFNSCIFYFYHFVLISLSLGVTVLEDNDAEAVPDSEIVPID